MTISQVGRQTWAPMNSENRFQRMGPGTKARNGANKRMHRRLAVMACLAFLTPLPAADPPVTRIMKWQDGKEACISLTFDDSSINQFRIDIPLLNERGMPGTFFIVTNDIQGSKNRPAFVGRPMMEIIRESGRSPTTKDNALE